MICFEKQLSSCPVLKSPLNWTDYVKGLITERYGVSLRIQSICGKIRTRITPNADTFYAVPSTNQQIFRIRLLNRNPESVVNLQLVLLIRNSISVEALRVCAIICLRQIFCLILGVAHNYCAAKNYHNFFYC